MIPGLRVVPAALAEPGDLIFHHQEPDLVMRVVDHGLDDYPDDVPIKRGLVARAVHTTTGIRWIGHAPGERYRGAELAKLAPEGVSFEGRS